MMFSNATFRPEISDADTRNPILKVSGRFLKDCLSVDGKKILISKIKIGLYGIGHVTSTNVYGLFIQSIYK